MEDKFIGIETVCKLVGMTEEEVLDGVLSGSLPPFVSTPEGKAWSRAEVEVCRGMARFSH